MPTLDLDIDAGALAQLTELPGQILAAVATAREALAAADESDSGNALGALLAGLGTLPDQLAGLPDLGDALGGLIGLGDLVPAGLPASAAGALDALGSLTGLLGPLAALVDGDVEAAVAGAVDQLAGLTTTLGEQSAGAAEVAGELRQFFTLLASLDGWSASAPPPAEVAGLVAKAFIGADLDILAAPVAALDAASPGSPPCCPTGPTSIGGGSGWPAPRRSGAGSRPGSPATSTGRPSSSTSRPWRGPRPSCIALRDQLVAAAVAALGRIDLGGLAPVGAALRAVPEIPEVRLTPVLDGFVAQLRALRDGLERWDLDADDVRLVVRGLVQRLRDAIDRSALGEIRRWLLGFEQRVLALIGGLPLRSIADEITGTLDGIARAIDEIDLAGLLAPVTQLGDTVGAAIADLGGDAVRNTVGQVWDAVEAALGEAAGILEQLRDALGAVTGPLTEFASRVGPAVTAITDLVAQVRVVVDAFDLAQPAAAVLDTLHRARDTVAAIDVSVLPAAAVQLVGEAADALAAIDVAAAVNGPIGEVLDAIDPGPALEAAGEVLAEVAAQLAAIDPSQLIATLDEPVGVVLDGLAALDPSRLQGLVDEALAPVREAIGALDASAVLAPATQAFADGDGQARLGPRPGPDVRAPAAGVPAGHRRGRGARPLRAARPRRPPRRGGHRVVRGGRRSDDRSGRGHRWWRRVRIAAVDGRRVERPVRVATRRPARAADRPAPAVDVGAGGPGRRPARRAPRRSSTAPSAGASRRCGPTPCWPASTTPLAPRRGGAGRRGHDQRRGAGGARLPAGDRPSGRRRILRIG